MRYAILLNATGFLTVYAFFYPIMYNLYYNKKRANISTGKQLMNTGKQLMNTGKQLMNTEKCTCVYNYKLIIKKVKTHR